MTWAPLSTFVIGGKFPFRALARRGAPCGRPAAGGRPQGSPLHTCTSSGQLRRVEAGEAAEGRGAADAVLAEAAGRVPARIEAGYDLAAQIDDLAGRVDADAGVGIVQGRGVPGRVERRR